LEKKRRRGDVWQGFLNARDEAFRPEERKGRKMWGTRGGRGKRKGEAGDDLSKC